MTMMGLILVAQAAAAQAAPSLPDIEIRARVQADRVEVRQQGDARVELRVDPGTAEPVHVERSAPPGQLSYRNLTIDLSAAARIADPGAPSAEARADTTATATQTGEPEE